VKRSSSLRYTLLLQSEGNSHSRTLSLRMNNSLPDLLQYNRVDCNPGPLYSVNGLSTNFYLVSFLFPNIFLHYLQFENSNLISKCLCVWSIGDQGFEALFHTCYISRLWNSRTTTVTELRPVQRLIQSRLLQPISLRRAPMRKTIKIFVFLAMLRFMRRPRKDRFMVFCSGQAPRFPRALALTEHTHHRLELSYSATLR
jgi:hypothetical protein